MQIIVQLLLYLQAGALDEKKGAIPKNEVKFYLLWNII